MPTTIPYDPSLVLGNIVHPDRLQNLLEISAAEAPVDAAEETLNSYIAMKRSLDMTIQEMVNMKIDASDLMQETEKVGKQVQQAAVNFANTKLAAEQKIQPLKAKVQGVHANVESPVDYNKTQIKKMPLSADSLKMNCQYFAYDKNTQTSGTHSAAVSGFAADEVSWFGDSYGGQVSSSVQAQMNSQHSRHSIAGTLVVSITCTHKEAALLAPFILDVDKGIRVWNSIYPDDMIKTNSITNMAETAMLSATEGEKSFSVLSGATYGSCFIGMVHILNTSQTTSSQVMDTMAESIKAQFKYGGWFAEETGSFGVDSSFSNDAKNLLSTQKISSHCSLVSMGSIPSIKSNQVEMGVQGFTQDDAAKSMKALQEMQNANAGTMDTVNSAAQKARDGKRLVNIQATKVKSVLSGLHQIDKESNKMIDTNSLMDALQDYVNKCIKGNIGVPINYYLKPITKSQLAGMWMTKYYPDQYQKVSGDDSKTS
ncbi:MAG: hypothetical protein N4A35_08730 [Flavobacteriales bacterium]|jgi:hypothetical protein|nr:hypothetical protein [Flavobacteriales bacterium]